MCCSGLFLCHDSVFVIVAHYRAGLQQTGKERGFVLQATFLLNRSFTYLYQCAILLYKEMVLCLRLTN